jgi:hypothetical protein
MLCYQLPDAGLNKIVSFAVLGVFDTVNGHNGD